MAIVRDWNTDYRDQAIDLVENGYVSAESMIIALVKYMSMDDVFDMLKVNEFMDDNHPNAGLINKGLMPIINHKFR